MAAPSRAGTGAGRSAPARTSDATAAAASAPTDARAASAIAAASGDITGDPAERAHAAIAATAVIRHAFMAPP
jgi:hypothetical protein